MPRLHRKLSSTQIYHVVIKGLDRQLMFLEPADYQKYLNLLAFFKAKLKFKIYAYCLMSNHVHLVIYHESSFSLSTIFRHINTTYAVWFNAKYDRTGPLQDDRFHSEPIEDAHYLINVINYIHHNPQKAGLEKLPGTNYRYSSFFDYERKTPLLTDTEYILDLLGGYDNFFSTHANYTEQKILDTDSYKKRLPDDVALDLFFQETKCDSINSFQKLDLNLQMQHILVLRQRGLSVRQLNRITGISRGFIERHCKISSN